jgi:hypothetical protein
MKKKFRHELTGYSGAIFWLSIIGLILLFTGVFYNNPYLIGCGGPLFGSSIGLFVGKLGNKDLYEKMITLYDGEDHTKINSDDSKLDDFRRIWYAYHITQFPNNDEWYWVQEKYDFAKKNFYGTLNASLSLKHPTSDIIYNYDVNAGIRGDKLIVLFSLIHPILSEKQVSIAVFPTATTPHLYPIPGFALLTTWTGKRAFLPVILSKEPLSSSPEYIMDSDTAEKLDEKWIELILAYYDESFLPRLVNIK